MPVAPAIVRVKTYPFVPIFLQLSQIRLPEQRHLISLRSQAAYLIILGILAMVQLEMAQTSLIAMLISEHSP